MVLVLASQLDEVAQNAVMGWPQSGATLLTASDLSTAGWFIDQNDFKRSLVVAGGKTFSVSKISGIITLIPYIFEYELFKIEEPNRRYAAAEMISFLYFVFTSLPCPRVNKPTPYNLTGPNWRFEEWLRACQQVSLPIKRFERRMPSPAHSTPPDVSAAKKITVLGDRVITCDIDTFRPAVLQLATLAGVEFLEATFLEENGRTFFSSANCIPDLANPNVLAALHERFCA